MSNELHPRVLSHDRGRSGAQRCRRHSARPPYRSARAALLIDVLPDDGYVLASSVRQLTTKGAQVLGCALGGALAAVIGSRGTLLLGAGTFLVAAALVVATGSAVSAIELPGGILPGAILLGFGLEAPRDALTSGAPVSVVAETACGAGLAVHAPRRTP